MIRSDTQRQHYDALAEAERSRLIRLCATLTGDPDAAEDLAQETLLIGWRLRDRITNWSEIGPWLSAIARNACRHWQRGERRAAAHLHPASQFDPTLIDQINDDAFDIELELERDELATLLDRALALLPRETRDVLVQKYVDESPHAEIAQRLGLSENAVAVRLHRGKLAFRRVLTTQLHDEAAAFGITSTDVDQSTRIWCPICGQQRLTGSFDGQRGSLKLRCPACSIMPKAMLWCGESMTYLRGITGIRRAIFKGMEGSFTFYREVAQRGEVRCEHCGRSILLVRTLPPHTQPPYPSQHGMYLLCHNCGSSESISLRMFVQSSPRVQRFWRDHPRMYTLPERLIERDGSAAIVTSFRSMTGSDQIDVVTARDTYAIRHIEQHS